MIKKTAILLIGAVLIVSVLTAGCSFNVGNVTPSPTSTTYTSAKGWSIAHTSDWGKPHEQDNGTVVVFLTPTNNETENLYVQAVNMEAVNLPANSTLSTVTEEIKSNEQASNDFKQIEAANTTLAGFPAYKSVYTVTNEEGNQLKVLETWTVKDGKVYLIMYKGSPSNYDTYLSAAQKMIDSFQIKSPTTTTSTVAIKRVSPTVLPSSTDLSTNLTNYMEGEGYTVVEPYSKHTAANGNVQYNGTFSDGEYIYVSYVEMTGTTSATAYRYNEVISNVKDMGFSTYDAGATYWIGFNQETDLGAYVSEDTAGGYVMWLVAESLA